MKLATKRRVAFVLVLVAGLFVYRPGANGLRRRIVGSIGLALAHKVDVDRVRVRLLPQPGFDLENFIIHDEPAFGAEPLLRAPEVTATLRLRSLCRGRLEIARLSLKNASINLVRSQTGHWNLESLLERAAHTPAVPTSQVRVAARPVFPYIEAENGRLNFKIGAEKKAYALTEADFALWLESENQWGMRLAAVPMRSDFSLSDTGILRVSGTWLRSASLRDTPLKFTLAWNRAQLGQFTKLIYGQDKGWRGGMTLSASLVGTPADLKVLLHASLDDFRRYDIVLTRSLQLSSTCHARYSSLDHTLSHIVCQSPVGEGSVRLSGSIGAPTGPRSYDLHLQAEDVPLPSILSLLERAKKNLPSDITSDGVLNGSFSFRTGSGQTNVLWEGAGQTSEFRLASRSTKTELELGKVAFTVVPAGVLPRRGRGQPPEFDTDEEPHLQFSPVALPWGKASSAHLAGWISRYGYSLALSGEAQVKPALEAARLVGLKTPSASTEGSAKMDMKMAGRWSDWAAPELSGSVQLDSLRIVLSGVAEPIEVDSANVFLARDEVRVEDLSASAAGAHWTGSMTLPRPPAREATFDLRADSLSWDALERWLSPKIRKHPWYRFPSFDPQPAVFLAGSWNASGHLTADRLSIRDLVARQVMTHLELHNGLLRLSAFRAQLLGGQYQADGEANLRATPPVYSGRGTFRGTSLSELANTMHDGWITGAGNGSYQLTATGRTSAQILATLSGTLDVDVRGGFLPHIVLAAGGEALRVRRFIGRMILREGRLEIQGGRLDTASGIYLVSGTASLGRKLNLRLARDGAPTYNVTGTLSQPHILPTAAAQTERQAKTQAVLKP